MSVLMAVTFCVATTTPSTFGGVVAQAVIAVGDGGLVGAGKLRDPTHCVALKAVASSLRAQATFVSNDMA